jgi:hypothetical protein
MTNEENEDLNDEGKLQIKFKLSPKKEENNVENENEMNYKDGEFVYEYPYENFENIKYKKMLYVDPKYSTFLEISRRGFARGMAEERNKYKYSQKLCVITSLFSGMNIIF